MIAAIDSAVLLHMIDPNIPVRASSDGTLPDRCQERLAHFVDRLSKSGGRLVVPTPVLTELLTKAGPAGGEWLRLLKGKKAVRVAPFDERAAIECAALAAQRSEPRGKTTRAKVKFDEQIVAISRVENAEILLSDDIDIKRLAPAGIRVVGIGELELTAEDARGQLFNSDDQKTTGPPQVQPND